MEKSIKEIKILIGEDFFFDKPSTEGLALLESETILLRTNTGNILLHELVHLYFDDERTKPAIIDLFNEMHTEPFNELMKHSDFLEYVKECFAYYNEEDWEEEIYAYHLENFLMDDFNQDSKEAIKYLQYYVFESTGVLTYLFFWDSSLERLD